MAKKPASGSHNALLGLVDSGGAPNAGLHVEGFQDAPKKGRRRDGLRDGLVTRQRDLTGYNRLKMNYSKLLLPGQAVKIIIQNVKT